MAVQRARICVPRAAGEAGTPPSTQQRPTLPRRPTSGPPSPAAGWHPYPLLVAQALSIAPESKLRPAVDWLSNEDDRLVRRPAPPDPWDVIWGPEHVSVVIPPSGYEAAAFDKK